MEAKVDIHIYNNDILGEMNRLMCSMKGLDPVIDAVRVRSDNDTIDGTMQAVHCFLSRYQKFYTDACGSHPVLNFPPSWVHDPTLWVKLFVWLNDGVVELAGESVRQYGELIAAKVEFDAF